MHPKATEFWARFTVVLSFFLCRQDLRLFAVLTDFYILSSRAKSLNAHNHGQNHRLALGFLIDKARKILTH